MIGAHFDLNRVRKLGAGSWELAAGTRYIRPSIEKHRALETWSGCTVKLLLLGPSGVASDVTRR